MTSKPIYEDPDDMSQDGGDSDGAIEVIAGDRETPSPESLPDQKSSPDRTSQKSPAYVAPIPKIGPIGPIPKISSPSGSSSTGGIQPPPAVRPPLPPFVGSFLMGKTVDEVGDIVDDKTGQVLARAGGDLPSIVGRKVSNREGDILGDHGELLGYVADIEIERKASRSPQQHQKPRSLFEVMGRSTAALMVDHMGNILDKDGNVVGTFHDNNNPMHKKAKEEQAQAQSLPSPSTPSSQQQQQQPQQQEKGKEKEKQDQGEKREEEKPETQSPPSDQQGQRRPRRTEEERRENAQAWRKENPGESPSDIFLDVKSTTEGIQLTIRIPTVFGGQQVRPNISFS